jgi:hypothetical protein
MVYAQLNTNFDYNGALLISKGADVEEYAKPDGTRIFRYGNYDKAVFKDGTVIERRDGGRNISYPDGMRLLIARDGSRRYLYPDGRERTVSMTGKTPYGEDIKTVTRRIEKNGSEVVVEYSAELSDDHLDGHIKSLFDELVIAVSEKYSGEKQGASPGMRIVVSNCRFCKTGYCSGKKESEVEIQLYRGKDLKKTIITVYSGIIKKERRAEFIERVLGKACSR